MARTHWIHLDEAYTWQPLGKRLKDHFNPSIVRSFPDHFAKVTEAQFNRLKAAWDEISSVSGEIKDGQR